MKLFEVTYSAETNNEGLRFFCDLVAVRKIPGKDIYKVKTNNGQRFTAKENYAKTVSADSYTAAVELFVKDRFYFCDTVRVAGIFEVEL